MQKHKYRRPGSRKEQALVPSLQRVVDEHRDDPLVSLESVRDDGRGLVLRTWDLHGPRMEEILSRGLEYDLAFATARRPDGVTAQSRLFTITQPEPITVATRTFGPITLPRSGAVMVDGGTDGRTGHRLAVDISGTADWERRNGVGSCGGCAGTGALGIHGKDWSDYLRLSDAAWSYMKGPSAPVRGADVPDWLWVVVMRLGDEIRMRESLPGTSHPPAEIADLLRWMARAAEGWCIASLAPETESCEPEPVRVAVTPAGPPSEGHVGGSIGDAVARVRNDGWGPIIPPLERGD